MTILWSLAVIVALLVGIGAGYAWALLRTPAVLSKMAPDQIESLAHKVSERRKHAPSQGAGNSP